MKKTIVVFAAMAMILSLGTAFAGSGKADGASKIDNGITYSDLGPAAKCAETPVTENQAKDNAFSNGISVSETRGSGAKGSCANKAEKEINSSRPYNGVSAF